MDEDALRTWVEGALGARVADVARVGSGASRATWRVELAPPSARTVVARVDTGDGPMSGTPLDLEREEAVYAALRDTPLPVPGLLAVHPGGGALLLEWAPGSEQFAAVTEESQRRDLIAAYMKALAALHRLEIRSLPLEGFARPRDARGAALDEIALWRGIHVGQTERPDPLLGFAFAWLADEAPRDEAPLSLCHGDAGPGNFLFEGGHITAMLDWEFAHLGDGHDDLAWVAVRAQLLGGFGVLSETLAVWSEATGWPISLHRVEYYRALVLARMAVSCLGALGFAEARPEVAMDTTVYRLLLPYLRYLLPQALARAGCADARRAALEKEGFEALQAIPTLAALTRPLDALDAG